MRKLGSLIVATALFLTTGCGIDLVSPDLDQRIDNQNGKIESIESLQNSMKNDIANINQRAEITDSVLKDVQNGAVNVQGIEFLNGEGGLVFILAIMFVSFVIYHYREQAKKNQKMAQMLADTIKNYNDPVLEEEVFKAALYTDLEQNVLKVMSKLK